MIIFPSAESFRGRGFQALSYYAFWLAVVAWLVMTAGVAFKGIEFLRTKTQFGPS